MTRSDGAMVLHQNWPYVSNETGQDEIWVRPFLTWAREADL